ncbi:MAG: hypothetical protein HY821_25760 [Acidobacteria bacterium]|nr:hypothetical protein [Acidobacteriota bacterium]
MTLISNRWWWRALAAALIVLPAILVGNAVFMLRELEQARGAYLRNTAAAIAARLEQEPAEVVAQEEPALAGLRTFGSGDGDAPAVVRSILNNEQLFYLERDTREQFRVWVPYHAEGGMRVACLDLNPAAGDFLTERPRRNLTLAIAVTLAMAALTGYALWARGRQARLERLAELGQMSAVLAHEIRNPLGALKGFLQLARERSSGDAVLWLDTSLEQTGRLERLVRDLLLYARVPQPQWRELRWQEFAARLRPHAPAARFSEADFTLRTDPDLLEQILLNLIRNAAEAGSEVAVDAEPGRVSVTDNGPGLPEEVRKRLFQPFFTTKAQGTGLGLAIANNLAGALNARLTLGDAKPAGTLAELRWTP